MTIKRVILTHIQSHIDTIYDFPHTGVIVIKGANGHGKSVLVKALKHTFNLDWTKPSFRTGFINRAYSSGEILIEFYDGYSVKVVLNAEASKTYYKFSDIQEPLFIAKNKETIKEKLDSLKLHSKSIQLAYDDIPLINDNAKENLDIIISALTDPIAEVILKNAELSYDSNRIELKTLDTQITTIEKQLTAIKLNDLDILEKKLEDTEILYDKVKDIPKLLPLLTPVFPYKSVEDKPIYKTLSKIKNISSTKYNIRNMKIYPSFKLLQQLVQYSNLHTKKIPKIIKVVQPISNTEYLDSLEKIKDIEVGICPTCKRRLDEWNK